MGLPQKLPDAPGYDVTKDVHSLTDAVNAMNFYTLILPRCYFRKYGSKPRVTFLAHEFGDVCEQQF